MAVLGAGSMELGKQDLLIAADHPLIFQIARAGLAAAVAARITQDVVAQRPRRQHHGLARHDRARARKGAGVIGGVRSVSALVMAMCSRRVPRVYAAI